MTAINSCAERGIESSDIWQTARRMGLYSRATKELEGLIAQHRCGPLRADRLTAEAARHVRNLRRGLAAGTFL